MKQYTLKRKSWWVDPSFRSAVRGRCCPFRAALFRFCQEWRARFRTLPAPRLDVAFLFLKAIILNLQEQTAAFRDIVFWIDRRTRVHSHLSEWIFGIIVKILGLLKSKVVSFWEEWTKKQLLTEVWNCYLNIQTHFSVQKFKRHAFYKSKNRAGVDNSHYFVFYNFLFTSSLQGLSFISVPRFLRKKHVQPFILKTGNSDELWKST